MNVDIFLHAVKETWSGCLVNLKINFCKHFSYTKYPAELTLHKVLYAKVFGFTEKYNSQMTCESLDA
jgi:hypothetical protein